MIVTLRPEWYAGHSLQPPCYKRPVDMSPRVPWSKGNDGQLNRAACSKQRVDGPRMARDRSDPVRRWQGPTGPRACGASRATATGSGSGASIGALALAVSTGRCVRPAGTAVCSHVEPARLLGCAAAMDVVLGSM